MRDKKILISTASWEERFGVSFAREVLDADGAIVLFVDEFESRTKAARELARLRANETSTAYQEIQVSLRDPQLSWRSLTQASNRLEQGVSVRLDISTSPREIIWLLLWHLQRRGCKVEFVYTKPARYGTWLSRDPAEPRLVYKLAGIHQPGRQTCLVMICGFDLPRTSALIRSFEPRRVFLGIQAGFAYAQCEEYLSVYRDRFGGSPAVDIFEVDAYGHDAGACAIERTVGNILEDYNVIAASLGPKPSAMALYALHLRHPSIGLAYLPARQFADDYSTGSTDFICGSIDAIGQALATETTE